VSRYLPDRLTAPSQTWRTFLANHLGDLAFISPVTPSSAPRDDEVVDARLVFRPAPLSCDAPCASNQWAVVTLMLSTVSIWRREGNCSRTSGCEEESLFDRDVDVVG
jgi:hypothetical protein